MNVLGKAVGYVINKQKSVVFFHISKELSENKISNSIHNSINNNKILKK